MTMFLLDPSLESVHGHHMEWDMAIAGAAQAREQDVKIITNKRCPLSILQGVEVFPWFSHSCYAELSRDPIFGRYDDFRTLNDELAEELGLLPREMFRATDVVLAPTVSEKHLLGYVSWMKSFDAALAPLFVVHLMFSSGLGGVDATGQPVVADAQQALFYGLAFRLAGGPGPRIHFFGGGRQLAREFSSLLGTAIDAHPIPSRPVRHGPPPGDDARRVALLFMGDAKADKGFLLIPELAQRLSAAFPDWTFIAHANAGASWGEAIEAHEALLRVAEQQPNVHVTSGRLTRDDYLLLMESADCYVCSYDPAIYARKSSGVIWEAISLGIPVLVPAGTWLSAEPREWGAAHMTYEAYSVDAIVAAFDVFSRALPDLVARSTAAAERYRAQNGPDALMNQIGALWVPRLLAASLTSTPVAQTLAMETFDEGWSYVEAVDGGVARWTGKSFVIRFKWPFTAVWVANLDVANCIAPEQLTEAKAYLGKARLAMAVAVRNGGEPGGRLRIMGRGAGRAQPDVEVRVELPWAYRPSNDERELGLFIRRVRLEPGAEDVQPSLQLEIETKVELSTDGREFRLSGVVSGFAQVDPARSVEIRLAVRTEHPELARAVRLFVNGVPLVLDTVAEQSGRWRARALVSSALLLSRGYRMEWDLQLAASKPDAAVWVADLTVVSQAPAGSSTQATELLPQRAPHADRAEPVRVQAAPDQPVVDDARLNEHFVDNPSYSHLDVSLFGLHSNGEFWAEVRFKFCSSHDRCYLEFRNLPGWPQVFKFWETARSDQFGPLVHIGDEQTLPSSATERETLLVDTVFAVLPGAVEALVRRSEPAGGNLEVWIGRAQGASRDRVVTPADGIVQPAD